MSAASSMKKVYYHKKVVGRLELSENCFGGNNFDSNTQILVLFFRAF